MGYLLLAQASKHIVSIATRPDVINSLPFLQ